MAASALHLVERVLPDVPLRQYVLSPPFELRGLLAANSTVVSKMVRVFVQAVFRRLERWAARQSLHGAQSGSVTAIQRFTKTLDVGVHLHGLFLDGVYVEDDADGPLRFVDAPPATQGELEQIAGDVFERMRRFLDDAGYLDTDASHVPTAIERWYLRSLDEPSGLTPTRSASSPEVGQAGGFTVHAGVTVARGDLRGREQLCRYVTRPPFCEQQLARTSDGRVELTLRKPAKNGQRKILLEPLRFLRKLAWLVPPPGRHMLRYGGILAPAARRRRQVVPRPPPQIQLAFPIENLRPQRQTFRPGWAALLARTFGVDAERCPRCGGRLRPIGAITDPTQARRALEHIRAPSARDPPQRSLPL